MLVLSVAYAAAASFGGFAAAQVGGANDESTATPTPTGVSGQYYEPPEWYGSPNWTSTPRPTSTTQPTSTPRPTNTPQPTSTRQATRTPRPTSTPKPRPRATQTPVPTATGISTWHQADNTVKYKLVNMPATPRPTVISPISPVIIPATPTINSWWFAPIPHSRFVLNIPPKVTPTPHPGAVFDNSIDIAVTKLHAAFGSAPGLLFCEQGSCNPRDGRTVRPDVITIKVVNANSSRCGSSAARACVTDAFKQRYHPHVGSGTMIIENPAIALRNGRVVGKYMWTDNWSGKTDAECRKENGVTICWTYLPSIIMHEFGHAAGILDIRSDDGQERHHLPDGQGIMSFLPYNGNNFSYYDREAMLNQYGRFHRPH